MIDSECGTINKKNRVKKMKLTEMRTLRRICGMTSSDGIKNECIRRNLGLANMAGKIREK